MFYVLKRRDPVWLESLPLSDPSGIIGLLGGDGCQVPVPAALLLATSTMMRNIMAGHLPPAYSPIVLSLPSVTGDALQVVVEILTKGAAEVSTDRMMEVQQVFKVMRVEGLLICDQFDSISMGHGLGREVKVEDGLDVIEGSDNGDNVKLEIIVKIEKEVNTIKTDLVENVAESITENSDKEDNTVDCDLENVAESITEIIVKIEKEVNTIETDLVENVAESITENSDKEDNTVDCDLENVTESITENTLRRQEDNKMESIESIEENTRPPKFGKEFIGRKKSKTKKVQSLKSFIPCDFCSKRFKRCDVLHAHIQDVHAHMQDEHKQNMFTCYTCDQSFKHRKHLVRHIDSIHKMKEYSCKFCEKKFNRGDTLLEHIRIIHEMKEYSCKFCEKKYIRNSNLLEHIRSIHEMKEYSCKFCEKKYQRSHTLRKHILSIHNSDYACKFCEEKFKRSGSLQRHIKLIHRN